MRPCTVPGRTPPGRVGAVVDNGAVRSDPTILHVDLDAFFAAVEQRDKPSLRGKPVVVGGVGGRGVVATASYEARVFGVRSAMSTREARARCPHAAYLTGRFDAYRESSRRVMALLRELSPLVEPLSLDEAFVDLAAADVDDVSVAGVTAVARRLKDDVREVTGGLLRLGRRSPRPSWSPRSPATSTSRTAWSSCRPGTEQDLLRPMSVSVIPGVGPATAERLRRVGVHTVAELRGRLAPTSWSGIVGQAHGTSLYRLARADDDRPVVRRAGGEVDQRRGHLRHRPRRQAAARGAGRPAGEPGRPSGCARPGCPGAPSPSRSGCTTSPRTPAPAPCRPRPTTPGWWPGWPAPCSPRSTPPAASGCSASASPGWPTGSRRTSSRSTTTRPADADGDADLTARARRSRRHPGRQWAPGMDVVHAEHGPGWVWGSGVGRVTVRFETAETGPGPVRTFRVDDPDLAARSATRRSDGRRP